MVSGLGQDLNVPSEFGSLSILSYFLKVTRWWEMLCQASSMSMCSCEPEKSSKLQGIVRSGVILCREGVEIGGGWKNKGLRCRRGFVQQTIATVKEKILSFTDSPYVNTVGAAKTHDLRARRSLHEMVDLTVRDQVLMAGVLWKEREFELWTPRPLVCLAS